jgi:membrane associated rhomboid family serine protease
MVAIYFFGVKNNFQVLPELGFYPDQPFLNFGKNIITAPFLHVGTLHLIGNLYFFLIFANDVESHLRPVKFVLFIFLSIVMGAVFTSLLAYSEGIPHVGFSGVVSAILIFYALQFRNTKIGFAFPYFNYISIYPKSGESHRHLSLRWIRLPLWLVFIWWIGKELFLYFNYEQCGISAISHSGHLVGYLCGFILWLLWGKKMKVSVK